MEFIKDLDTFRDSLSRREVRFCFVKKDGSLRDAWGTTCLDLIPATEHPKGKRRPSPAVVTFFDTRKQAWRCLRRERFVAMIIE